MTARMAVITLAVVVALGGLGVGYVRTFDEGSAQAVDSIDLRKDDSGAELVAEEDDDEGDGDKTRGNDGTGGGNNTGDGDNSYVAPATPNYGGGGDSGGGYDT